MRFKIDIEGVTYQLSDKGMIKHLTGDTLSNIEIMSSAASEELYQELKSSVTEFFRVKGMQ